MHLALEMAATPVGADLASTEGLWEGSGREGSGRGVAGEWQEVISNLMLIFI